MRLLRLSQLASPYQPPSTDSVLAAVASQVLNVYLRAVSVELKAKEQGELLERLEALEAQVKLPAQRGGNRWRA